MTLIAMSDEKKIGWILRIAITGEFLGHGVFALLGKAQWVGWIQKMLGTDPATAGQLLLAIGLADLAVAAIVLFRPVRSVLLWAAVWGFWTALVRPLVGEPVWDFVERSANWGAPLALLLLLGWPKNAKEWLS